MSDFNFFEPYLASNRGISPKRILIISVCILTTLAIIIYPFYLSYNIKTIQKEIDENTAFISSSETKEKVNLINKKRKILQEIKEDAEFLTDLKSRLAKIDIINDKLIKNLTAEMPKLVFLNNLTIENKKIQITATSSNRVSIAQLEYNLRNSQYFDDVFISAILEKDNNFVFHATLKIKDVGRDGIE